MIGWRAGLRLFFGCALLLSCVPAAAEVVEITSGRLLVDPSDHPPPDSARWEPVSLPDDWAERRPGLEGNAWYRFELPPLESSEAAPLAIHLPEFNMAAELWLNGRLLESCGRLVYPVSQCWNTPLLATLPAGLLTREANRLDVRLYTYAPYGGLSAIRLGPLAELAPRHARQLFLQVTIPELFTVLAAVVVLFMASFAASTRDSVYLYFGAVVASWALAMTNNWVEEIPVRPMVWQWIVHQGFDWLGPLCVLFTHRLVGLQRPWVDRGVVAFGVASALATGWAATRGLPTFHDFSTAGHVGTLLVGSYAQVMLFVFFRRLTPLQRVFFVVGGSGTIILGIHDTLIQTGHLARDVPHLFPFAAPLLTISFAAILTIRFLRTFNRARQLNVTLEERVQQKHAELEASFERERRLERERALAQERERIMREVHDGIGGSLASALATVEGGGSRDDVQDSLRGALEDMRIVIDSLDPDVEDVGVLLGMLRGRLEPRLRRHGLRFEWQVEDVPAMPSYGPGDLLHVMRIVQEAIGNTIKHSGAKSIRIATGVASSTGNGDCVRLEVSDDGCGLPGGAADGPGRGLSNMAARAGEIGAKLEVRERAGGGTTVEVLLPLGA